MMISALLVIALLCVAFYAYRVMARGNALALPLLLLSFTGIFFVFFPEETIVIANKLGVGRGTDLLLYLCFVTGSILIVLIHIKFRHQSIEITELARAIALANPMRPPARAANADNRSIALERNPNTTVTTADTP